VAHACCRTLPELPVSRTAASKAFIQARTSRNQQMPSPSQRLFARQSAACRPAWPPTTEPGCGCRDSLQSLRCTAPCLPTHAAPGPRCPGCPLLSDTLLHLCCGCQRERMCLCDRLAPAVPSQTTYCAQVRQTALTASASLCRGFSKTVCAHAPGMHPLSTATHAAPGRNRNPR
jgi:hypothetical protein